MCFKRFFISTQTLDILWQKRIMVKVFVKDVRPIILPEIIKLISETLETTSNQTHLN